MPNSRYQQYLIDQKLKIQSKQYQTKNAWSPFRIIKSSIRHWKSISLRNTSSVNVLLWLK